MRYILGLVIALLCACCPPNTARSVQQLSADATVALVRGDDHDIFCAGVWVEEHVVLTANHCAQIFGKSDAELMVEQMLQLPHGEDTGQKAQIYLHDNPEQILNGVVVRASQYDDLALVFFADPPVHAVARIGAEPSYGEPIYVIGHPGGFGWSFTRGWVVGERSDLDRLQLSAATNPGNSGGGAWNDQGELVGICSFKVRGMEGTGFFVGPAAIRRIFP